MLHPQSLNPVPLNPSVEADKVVLDKLRAKLGGFFAERVVGDSVWARGILSDDVSTLS